MRRVRDAEGQTVLTIDGSLPPRMSGPPLHVHFHQREEGIVKAGSLEAQIRGKKIVVPAGGRAIDILPSPRAVAHRHTQAVTSPPQVIQRIVFPLILFVGRVLGKYRGDNWPGSPASCTGAPEV
jgi:hypothetical protein